jgi:predicted transcriptional regulator
MKQVLIEIDDQTLRELERIAPASARKRSAFIRDAIRKALLEAAEQRMAEAYRRMPDTLDPGYFEPDEWEPVPKPARRSRRGR